MMVTDHDYVLRIEGEGEPRTIKLPVGITRIGRVEGNDIVLPHSFVSSRHAQLDVGQDTCVLTDLGSTNGTLVDGRTLAPNQPFTLDPSHKVRIGPFTLSLERIPITPPPPAEVVAPPRATAPPPAAAPPPIIPPPPPGDTVIAPQPDFSAPPPGLGYHSERLLNYLPGIYQSDFTARFLGIFEAILTPIEWTVDNFDLFLHPGTAPEGFLPWLAAWYDIVFDHTWPLERRRRLLREAHAVFAMRGTRWALARILEIYTGRTPEIRDLEDPANPFLFTVRLPVTVQEVNPELVEKIIDLNKPAHTTYKLLYRREG